MLGSVEKENRRQRVLTYLCCLLISFLFITICSRSSFLYPFNDWVDDHCFFTVGKAMFNGKVVYRDIYEQKGILLYFLYGLAYLFSHTDFSGVYLLEIISYSFFLYLVVSLAGLFLKPFFARVALVFLSAVLCSTYAFHLGGSVEQLSLPLVFSPIYCLCVSYWKDGSVIPKPKMVFVLGILAGCLLWMKYTLLGIYFGYVLLVVIACVYKKDYMLFLRSAGQFLLGVVCASAPWLIYFAVHGALEDAFRAYFYNNIMLYPSHGGSKLSAMLTQLYFGFTWNGRMSLLILLSAAAVIVSKTGFLFKLGMFLLYVSNVLFIYAGGMPYDYYPFGTAALAVPGGLALVYLVQQGWSWVLRKRQKSKRAWHTAASVGIFLMCMMGGGLFAYRHSVNSFYMSYDKDELWITEFKEVIEQSEDQSILNYGFLDLGLYTVTGYVPETKFFCHLNLELPEMHQVLDDALRNRETEFVVTVSENYDLICENYNLICQRETFDSFEDRPLTVYLYRRK